MDKIKKVELIHGNKRHNLLFKFCQPGSYRISNIPNIANKNIKVEISNGFWMQEITVSIALWEFVLGETESVFKVKDSEKDLYPIHDLSFTEIKQFLSHLNLIAEKNNQDFVFDCPSFVEWEHALLCGRDGSWSWGEDDSRLSQYAWFSENSDGRVNLSKQKMANSWGLYDMYGNVHEYCYNVNLRTGENPVIDPMLIQPGFDEVMPCLGGAYNSFMERCREFNVMGVRNEFIEPTGFRLIIRTGSKDN